MNLLIALFRELFTGRATRSEGFSDHTGPTGAAEPIREMGVTGATGNTGPIGATGHHHSQLWRPDNWYEDTRSKVEDDLTVDSNFPIFISSLYAWNVTKRQLFEAGADAMLEALIENQ